MFWHIKLLKITASSVGGGDGEGIRRVKVATREGKKGFPVQLLSSRLKKLFLTFSSQVLGWESRGERKPISLAIPPNPVTGVCGEEEGAGGSKDLRGETPHGLEEEWAV